MKLESTRTQKIEFRKKRKTAFHPFPCRCSSFRRCVACIRSTVPVTTGLSVVETVTGGVVVVLVVVLEDGKTVVVWSSVWVEGTVLVTAAVAFVEVKGWIAP
jgi:hypothetical protein